MMELPVDFVHDAPEGYSYEVEEFKRNVISIWLLHHQIFSYTSDPVRTIWGFYNTKKREYFAPINSKKCGSKVIITDTTPYTSMKVNRRGLELLWM